jgi:FHA domain/TIR domain
MEATLKSLLGSIPLRNSVLRIGRSPNSGLFINHATVSRHHAEIRPDGSGYSLVDLGSTSGTFVNGERLVPQTPRMLRSGDELQVGSFSLTYEEQRSSLSLDTPPTLPLPGFSPNGSLPGATARTGSSADHPPARGEALVASEALSLSPVSDGLLHATDAPFVYQPEPAFPNGYTTTSGGSSADFLLKPTSLEEPARQVGLPLASLPAGTRAQPLNLAQQQLQFTAFYAREVVVETWQTLLVYTHVQTALEAVRKDARRLLAQSEAEPANAAEIIRPATRGTQITVVPVFSGVTFQAERISFPLTDEWHPATLRFSVERRLAGTVVTGEILLLAGPLIIASLRVTLHCAEPGARPDPAQGEISVARYKNIFTSYSHDDSAMVQALSQVYEALGDESFSDIQALRSGQNWQSALPRAIDSADVFQLFWSPHAAQSQLVYQECQYALQHYKYDGFIRSIYWQKPLEFAPPELSHLPFTYYELPEPNISRRSNK